MNFLPTTKTAIGYCVLAKTFKPKWNGKTNLCMIYIKVFASSWFSGNWHSYNHFRVPGMIPEVDYARKIHTFCAPDRRTSSNIDGAMVDHNFDICWDLMTSSIMSSILIHISMIRIAWCICTSSLVMISVFVLSYLEKCANFIYKVIYKADFVVHLWCRHHHKILSLI